MIDRLNAQAGKDVPRVDNQIGLNIYARQATNLYDQGTTLFRGGDLDGAYVSWMRYLELVVVRMPGHLQYNLPRFAGEQAEHKGKARRLMGEVETLRKRIFAREVAAAAADFAAFPAAPEGSGGMPRPPTNGDGSGGGDGDDAGSGSGSGGPPQQ